MLPLAKNLKVLGRFQAGNKALEAGYKEAAQAAAVSDAAKRHRGINAHLPKGHFFMIPITSVTPTSTTTIFQ